AAIFYEDPNEKRLVNVRHPHLLANEISQFVRFHTVGPILLLRTAFHLPTETPGLSVVGSREGESFSHNQG
ncbi:MAG: hypothetical protein ACO292_11470, partial [Ilumatobacteraceae bacterium]